MCSRRVKVKELVWWRIWLRLLPMTALLMRHWKRFLYVIVLQTTGSPSSKYFKYHQCISTYHSFNESISCTNSLSPSQWIRPSLVQRIRRCLVPSHYQTYADCVWISPRGTNFSEIGSKTPAFYFKKCIWKYCLYNIFGHFVPASMPQLFFTIHSPFFF